MVAGRRARHDLRQDRPRQPASGAARRRGRGPVHVRDRSAVRVRAGVLDGRAPPAVHRRARPSLPPALRGLLGEPINLETMGGFLSWRVGNTLPVMLGLWPVIALSGTLAGEAAKGSLDLLASTPQSRRTIALEKLAGHVTAVAVAMLHARGRRSGSSARCSGRFRATRSRSAAALGQVVLYGVMMLVGRWRRFRDGAVPRPDPRDGVRADRPVRELPDLQLRDAVAAHRRAQAAVVLQLDRRPPTDGRASRDWPSVGVARRRRRRAVRGRRRRLRPTRSRRRRERRLAPAAVAAGRDRRAVQPPARRSGRASPSRGASASGCTGSSSSRRPTRSAT